MTADIRFPILPPPVSGYETDSVVKANAAARIAAITRDQLASTSPNADHDAWPGISDAASSRPTNGAGMIADPSSKSIDGIRGR
jgi:hypothetical protein